MDRPPRLRRYLNKDYSQRVEFPVEILGRDNEVRRYAFDDAVRLYHRRIETAAMRYADPETVDAEVSHCRARVEQLRRSYILAAGQARPLSLDGILAGPMAADVLFFLRRVLGEAEGDAAAASLVALDGGDREVWWWRGGPAARGAWLYAFRLDGRGPPGARLALERELGRLRAASGEPDAEHLYVGVLTDDLALLLAGTEVWSGPAGLLTPASPMQEDGPADPWRAAMGALQEGQVHAALTQLEAALDNDPSRRVLARSGAVVALMAHEPGRAEFIARFGLLAQPGDPRLRYLLALAQFMQGRAEASAGLEAQDLGPLALLGALHAVGVGGAVSAWRAAARARRGLGEADWFVFRAARQARVWAAATVLARVGVGAAAGGGVAALWAGNPAAAALAAGLAALGVWAEQRIRADARAALAQGRVGAVRLCPPELLPREGESPKN